MAKKILKTLVNNLGFKILAGFPSFGDIFHHRVLMHFYSFLVWGYIIL